MINKGNSPFSFNVIEQIHSRNLTYKSSCGYLLTFPEDSSAHSSTLQSAKFEIPVMGVYLYKQCAAVQNR